MVALNVSTLSTLLIGETFPRTSTHRSYACTLSVVEKIGWEIRPRGVCCLKLDGTCGAMNHDLLCDRVFRASRRSYDTRYVDTPHLTLLYQVLAHLVLGCGLLVQVVPRSMPHTVVLLSHLILL